MDLIYCTEKGFQLEHAHDFKSFKCIFKGIKPNQYPQIAGLEYAEAQHVWIDQKIIQQFSAGKDWNQKFQNMLINAQKYGWVHEQTEAVKAHVIWQEAEKSEPILVVEENENYRIIRLNRPKKRNALTVELLKALNQALIEANEDESCRAILLTGEGLGFCAGQDLNERKGLTQAPNLQISLEQNYHPVIQAIVNSEKPIICAVNGVAAGAGVGLALACDIVLAAASAKFILSFAQLGLGPDAGVSWSLARQIGVARAKAMAILGQPISAQQAQDFGMLWQVYADETLEQHALQMTKSISQRSPQAMKNIKQCFLHAPLNNLEQQLNLEAKLQYQAGQSIEYRKNIEDFFNTKIHIN